MFSVEEPEERDNMEGVWYDRNTNSWVLPHLPSNAKRADCTQLYLFKLAGNIYSIALCLN